MIEFDYAGNVVRRGAGRVRPGNSDGPPGERSPDTSAGSPSSEHGMFIDYKDNVWLSS